ncbi:hypothetical protein QTN25_008857 [Entamoeba marina]
MVELEKQTQSIDGMKNQILELEKFVQTSKNISVSQKSDKSDVKLIPSSTDKPQTSRPQKQQITSASPKLEDKPAEELLTKFSHNHIMYPSRLYKAMINEAQNKGIQSGTNTTSNAFRAAGFI